MKYVDLLESLQKKKENEGHIVMMKNGLFFIGIGKDAIILNKLLNLKCVCMRENLCKAGFQIRSVEKYIKELKKLNKSFVIYNYDKENQQEDEIIRFQSENVFENRNCLECKNCNNKKETEAEIIERVRNSANCE